MMSNRASGDEEPFLQQYLSTPRLDTFRSGSSNSSSSQLNNKDNNGNISNNINGLRGSTHALNPSNSFSTFSHHKVAAPTLPPDLRYRDDPNPYKVSNIGEYRSNLQIREQYSNGKPVTHRSQQLLTFYTDDGDIPFVADDQESVSPTEDAMISSKYYSRDYSPHQQRFRTQASSNSPRSAPRNLLLSSSLSDSARRTAAGSDIDGEYEIPDPDYEGSTAGSSEDLPFPLADCCEDYSSSTCDRDTYNTEPDYPASPIPEQETTINGRGSTASTPTTQISEEDRVKIEYALKGRKTSIYVSNSLANLYAMNKSYPPRPNSTGSGGSSGLDNREWILKYTGVPVLLLDTGETKSRDKRKIQIVLAELGSGLALWKDIIDNLSNYSVMDGSTSYHTMHLSSDHTTIIGLSFDDEDGAKLFANRVDKLTSDFANISLSGAKTKSKGRKDKNSSGSKAQKYVKPKKTEISQPCCFHHVSSLSSNDKKRFSSLQNFVVSNSGSATKDNIPTHSPPTLPQTLNVSKGNKLTSSGSELSF